ncbi:hypothetical protein I6G66_12705 [Delftia acidovorans]|uniref:Uncharacterized protein n=1 Tax=Delftia acidovorans TaxID=80866 RepID=A0A7T2S8K4_DELAC|nr:hypothetical protein [Delftia acidovorans]QPS10793.1 hypothetical protein I6G66_12705 [Delftia acidovorans]
MIANTRNIARKYGAKIAAATAIAMAATASHAAGMDDLLDSIDLSSTSTKIGALALVIVGIALVMKGPSVVKRIIAKI